MIQNITIWPFLIIWKNAPSPSITPNTTTQQLYHGRKSSGVKNTLSNTRNKSYYINPITYNIHKGSRYIDTSLMFRSISNSPLFNKIKPFIHLCLTMAEWEGKLTGNSYSPSQIKQFLSMAIQNEILLPNQQESNKFTTSSKESITSIKKWDNPKICNDIITVLNKLSMPQDNSSMLSFCQRVTDHFGDKMIPLTTLLDPIFGLGYSLQITDHHYPANMHFTHSIHRVESEIFNSIINNTIEQTGKANTIHLTYKNIIDLEDNIDAMPQIFALRITTCNDKGEEKYLINYAIPAGKLLEEILSTPQSLTSNDAKVQLEKFQTQFKKTYNTEVRFSPFQLSNENCYTSQNHMVSIYPIFDSTGSIYFPNDLYFSATNIESGIYSYSKKIFLTPYVPSTQNSLEAQIAFGAFFRDMYQFLNPLPLFSCYLMDKRNVFFPRVEYNNLILFPKTWIFNTAWIFQSNASESETIQQLQGLFRLYCVPQYIIIQDSTNDVVRSTTDPTDLLHTIQTIRRMCNFVFCEALGLENTLHEENKKPHHTEYILIYKEVTE